MLVTDYLVIGSGIAGLSYALKVAEKNPESTVTIITKAGENDSNTRYAQGGIATVIDKTDSFEDHIKDTLIAGDGLCNEKVVRMVVSDAPKRLEELIAWGTDFDRTDSGDYDLGKEGGHSTFRILHHKDITGYEIQKKLIKKVKETPNISLLDHHFAIDLITEHHLGEIVKKDSDVTCFGVYTLNQTTDKIFKILSKITLLASGGSGQVYSSTTNPNVATGDGLALAYRAKAKVSNMEFIQFHPTALYNPGESPAFLISEAVRGFGGRLFTKTGERFMKKYDNREELASRDIVARAIDSELKISGDQHVLLDCSHIEKEELLRHFPNIYAKCMTLGIDIARDPIPVVPASHYQCGGINVDTNGQTSIKNLYACGECTNTGLHGANRLASNSLLEAIVYSHKILEDTISNIDSIEIRNDIPLWNAEGTSKPKEKILISHNKRELQNIMSDYVGIVRTNQRLDRAIDRLKLLYLETEKVYDKSVLSPQLCELRNMITVSYLIIKHSLQRSENRGGFYNRDLE
jgi:L-aspartate oxidase